MSDEPKNVGGYKQPEDYTTILDSTNEFGLFWYGLHGIAPNRQGIASPLVIETEERKRLESIETPNTFTKPPF